MSVNRDIEQLTKCLASLPAEGLTYTPRDLASEITRREYFAAMAMQGSVCANDHHNPEWHSQETAEKHAKGAVMLADALIKALEEK